MLKIILLLPFTTIMIMLAGAVIGMVPVDTVASCVCNIVMRPVAVASSFLILVRAVAASIFS